MSSLAGNRVILWGAQQCDLNALEESLVRQGCLVHTVESLEELRAVMEGIDADLIVVRLCRCLERVLLEVLGWMQEAPSPPVLIVADALDVDLYLEAMRRGAFDCVGLPLNENELIRIMSRALEARHTRASAAGGGK